MNWNTIEAEETLQDIESLSKDKAVMIFKHSTRCSISAMVLDRLERNWNDSEMTNVQPYILDLIQFREISNEVASRFDVFHQSPQVLIIKDGKAIHDASHMAIDYRSIKQLAG